MRELVRGYILAVRDIVGEARLEAAVDEVQSFVELARSTPILGEVVEDRGIPAALRSQAVADVIVGRVSPEVLRLIAFAVRSELPGVVIEGLEEATRVLREPFVIEGEADYATRSRVRGYAAGWIDGSSREVLAVLVDELTALLHLLAENPALERFLSGYSSTAETRTEVVAELFASKVSAALMHILWAASGTSGVRSLRELIEQLQADGAKVLNLFVAEVITAKEPTPSQRERLLEFLAGESSREVELDWRVDPAILGGLVALVGDRLYDASVATQLDRARRALVDQV